MGHEDGAEDRAVRWEALVFVCRKCCKRARRKRVRGELRDALREATGSRRVRVVASSCLGICPKGGVAVASAATLARGQVLVLPAAAGVDPLVAARLLPERR